MVLSHETTLGKVIRFPFRLIPRGAVVPIVRGPGRGMWWVSHAAAHGYWLGFWELGPQQFFAGLLRRGDVVYDIGAHVGLYMLGSSARVGKAGHVYAFEPLPRNAKFLRRHVALNRLSNCTIVESAVCESPGTRRLDASICHSEARLSDTGAIRVAATSVDEFVFHQKDHRAPTVLRIDARGAALAVLAGARRSIQDYAPRIVLFDAFDDVERQYHQFLSSLEYSLARVGPSILQADPKRRLVTPGAVLTIA